MRVSTILLVGLSACGVLPGIKNPLSSSTSRLPSAPAPAKAAMGKVASAKLPAWCATEGLDLAKKGDDHNVEGALKKDEPAWALYYLVGATCSKDEDVDEHRGELEEARRYWNQKLDMTEADWADVADWAGAEQGARYYNSGFFMEIDEKKPWSQYDALEQFISLRAQNADQLYMMDAFGPGVTQTGRLAFIESCIRDDGEKEARWALCQPDLDAFDPGKVSAELRAAKPIGDQPLGYQRTIVRMTNYKVRELLADHANAVKQLIAKDDAYGKLFSIAKAAHHDWEGRTKRDAELLALVTAMDGARLANSRKALEGCDEKTWAAWTAAVGKIPAKEFEGMHDDPGNGNLFIDKAIGPIIGNPEAYLATVAVGICHAGDERDDLVTQLGSSLERWPGFRGPRNSALTAMLGANITLDERGAKLRFPSVTREWFGPQKYSRGGGGSGHGVIATAKPNGGKVHVTFPAQMVRQVQCAQYRETNRLSRIDSSGNLVYQQQCVRNETVVVNKASDPQDVLARYANGLKPGVYTTIFDGIAQGVWASPTADTPIAVFGVPVK